MNLQLLHAVDPYAEFEPHLMPARVDGWNSEEPAFLDLIQNLRPKLIVEVGTWMGASAIHMGRCLERAGIADCKIVCVDTWLGAVEFWTNQADPTRYQALALRHGYPTVYYQFLSNVIHAGLQQMIIPFPQASTVAARWFEIARLKPDLIYIDGSHESRDVLADLNAWWPVLRNHGTLFGDDWHTFADVRKAVSEFAQPLQQIPFVSGNKWILRKP
jgi:hypothetical protein